MYDVTIIGAGLAGLQLARLLARGGASVLLVDRRHGVGDAIRTTGIFVRRTFEEFAFLDPYLGPSIRSIGLHSPAGRTLELTAEAGEFRVGRMAALCEALLCQAIAAGVTWWPATTYAGCERLTDHVRVRLAGGSVESRFLVGADGARSRVARDLGLDLNHQWIVGVEDVFRSLTPLTPRFDCWIDSRVAPGYLAWIVDDGCELHVGVGGDPKRFRPSAALLEFERRMRGEGRIGPGKALERRGGLIPVNGVLRRIGGAHGLLVGDAAGAVSPLTAGGLDACLRLSAHAAATLLPALQSGTLTGYDGAVFRSRFSSRLAMRRAFGVLSRSPLLVELGFTAAKMSIAKRVARHIFFGRGSFPDVAAHPSSLAARAGPGQG